MHSAAAPGQEPGKQVVRWGSWRILDLTGPAKFRGHVSHILHTVAYEVNRGVEWIEMG